MGSEANGESFLRQLSLGGDGIGKQGLWNYSSPSSSSNSSYYTTTTTKGGGGGGGVSKRWGKKKKKRFMSSTSSFAGHEGGGSCSEHKYGNRSGVKKRVIVVIDNSTRAKQAMMWAVTHVANRGDLLTLLHVIPSHHHSSSRGGGEDAPNLANSLASLCKACKPEVEVEALVIKGPKLATVLSQVKKLEAAVLVLSQSKPSSFCCLFSSSSSSEEFVEQCINKAECLTLAVRKQSKGVGGYLVSTRWQKNFWLLA